MPIEVQKSMVHDSTPSLGAEPLQCSMDGLSQQTGAWHCSWRPKSHMTETWLHSRPLPTFPLGEQSLSGSL